MSDETTTPTDSLTQIRERANFGLNSDADGARNALEEIVKICDAALAAESATEAS